MCDFVPCDRILQRAYYVLTVLNLGTVSKTPRQRQRKRHETKGSMKRTMAVQSLYISLPSSAKQQCEMTKCGVFWRT